MVLGAGLATCGCGMVVVEKTGIWVMGGPGCAERVCIGSGCRAWSGQGLGGWMQASCRVGLEGLVRPTAKAYLLDNNHPPFQH